MKNTELLKSLILSAESLNFADFNRLNYIRDRAMMIFSNVFHEDNSYTNRMLNIRFETKNIKSDKEYNENIWNNAKQELVNLFKIASEHYEEFIASIDYDDFFYTVTKYLADQDTPLDKNISILLNYADFEVEESTQFSRYNCVWANAIIKLPPKLRSKFTKEMEQRLADVLNYFRPSQWSIDFSGVTVEAKIERAYDNWRDDILNQLIGSGLNNQASFPSSKFPMIEYNGMKFRSKSEKALAPFFESSKVLFFPLPLAVYENDHKEPDFLVCKKGNWAILEIVDNFTHPSVEKEAIRTSWFQNHNIQIRQYPATQCYKSPKNVVDDFLKWIDGLKS